MSLYILIHTLSLTHSVLNNVVIHSYSLSLSLIPHIKKKISIFRFRGQNPTHQIVCWQSIVLGILGKFVVVVCVLVCVCVIMQDLHGVSMMLKRERERELVKYRFVVGKIGRKHPSTMMIVYDCNEASEKGMPMDVCVLPLRELLCVVQRSSLDASGTRDKAVVALEAILLTEYTCRSVELVRIQCEFQTSSARGFLDDAVHHLLANLHSTIVLNDVDVVELDRKAAHETIHH